MIFKSLFVSATILGLTVMSGCNSLNSTDNISKRDLKYPYHANVQRSGKIQHGVSKLFLGIPQDEVVKLMGEPDEKNVFSSNLGGKPEGYVWVYIIQREKPSGSFVERKEKSIKLRFGLNKKLINIDYLGLRKPTAR